jgi:hypothetical protein
MEGEREYNRVLLIHMNVRVPNPIRVSVTLTSLVPKEA